MPRKGSALIRSFNILLDELVKGGWVVEFKMDMEEGYIKWKIKQNGK